MAKNRNLKAYVYVWDVPVRLFHWFLFADFVTAYLSAKFHFSTVHELTGYFLCFLLLARIIWGFSGTQFARFKSFTFSQDETISYLKSIYKGNPQHYFGHNPAGALMVFALLTFLILVSVSGLTTLAVIDFDGPFLFLIDAFDDETSYFVRHLHGWLVNVVLVLSTLHLFGVITGSMQHQENLVKAMFTGKKQQHIQ